MDRNRRKEIERMTARFLALLLETSDQDIDDSLYAQTRLQHAANAMRSFATQWGVDIEDKEKEPINA